jgi:hypothetical protein
MDSHYYFYHYSFTMGRKKDKTGETVNLSSGSGTTVRVSLNDQVLQDALDIYLDETKPDPLIRQQLSEPTSSWSWVEESADTAAPVVAELLEEATHYLAGIATWSGAYASVDLRVRTCWKASTTTKSVDDDGESHKKDDCNGSLVTVCHASARWNHQSRLRHRRNQRKTRCKKKSRHA